LPNERSPISITSRNADILKGKIQYQPFRDVESYAKKELKIHFYDINAALFAKHYQKTVKVAFWRSLLHIQEDFEVHNRGAAYLDS
jgi:hypothetical protein